MKKLLAILTVIIVLSACEKEDDSILKPNAGTDRLVTPLELVELDGTATSGTEDYTFTWTYDGEVSQDKINFQNTNTLKPTFIPPQQGLYFFTLTITDGVQSASDIVKIEASGGFEIGGTLKQDLMLSNIETDPDKPDYIITSDIIIPSGLKCMVVEEGVVIGVLENRGIVIEQGGLFSNYHTEYQKGYETVFKSSTGWKGILVKGGTLSLQNARIEKAGLAAFTGYTEKGAIMLTEGSVLEQNFSNNVFIGSLATDFIMADDVEAKGIFTDNTLSNTVPMKIPFNYLHKIEDDNNYPASYDYIHLIPKVDKLETLPEFTVFYMRGQKYFIDGTLHLGAYLFVELGSELYFKEGNGLIVIDGSFTVMDYVGSGPVIMDGLNSAPWKGIAGTGKVSITLRSVEMLNAGNGVFNTPLFKSEHPAAVYHDTNEYLRIQNSHIKNSGGYGVYYTGAGGNLILFTLDNTIYENTKLAAFRSPVRAVDEMIRKDHGNTFIMNEGVPAVLVEADPEFRSLKGTWEPVGDNNYYLIDTDLIRTFDEFFRIMPGAILKFTKDKQLIFEYAFADLGSFKAMGTAENPIILDSANPNEKWGGIRISGIFEIAHCHIKNAGSKLLPGAPFLTNIFIDIDLQASIIPFLKFKDCHVTGSDGYGTIANNYVTPGWDPGNPDNNITFMDNKLGDIFYTSD
jgi:hypothetical protein